MKRLGSIRSAVAAVVLGGLVAAGVAVATAQAASNKPYAANVHRTLNTPGSFTLTLTNDPKASQSLGSANFTAPTGFAPGAVSNITNSGFNVSVAGRVVQFRAKSSATALGKGQSVSADVAVTISACATATWTVEAKQSNDFSGQPGNDMTLNPASDLTPLGSFHWDPVGTTVNGVFAPALYTTNAANYPSPSPTVHGLDTCGAPKTGYSGPTTLTYNGAPDKVTVSGPSPWSASGVGTVSIAPTISETNRSLTVTDSLTGISGASDPFDTQDKLCTSVDISCSWGNGNSINASSHGPGQGSLGVGFNPVVPFSCSGGNTPLGHTVITIAPHGTSNPGDHLAYQVTIVYSKQASGTGSANAFVFCESTTDGATWTLLPSCAASAGTTVDCIVDQKRVTGGALQVILSLVGDPYVGGK